MTKRILLLVSSTSMDREVKSRQERARTLLNAGGIDFSELDGSKFEAKERRNELFDLSGMVGYPQFFLVDSSPQASFLGDFDTMEAINDASSLEAEILDQNPDLGTWDRLLNKDNGDELLMLMSSMPHREAQQRQDRALLLMKARHLPFSTLDGADPNNKELRNQLFEMSGIRAQYPQLFLLKNVSKTSFLGTWEEIEIINDTSRLPYHVLRANPSLVTWEKVLG